jgi:glycosyltransferase involved in cell wall biosynthesis
VTHSDSGARTRRIALVLGSSTGGIGRHVSSLAAGLAAEGVTVVVYGPMATERQFGFTGLGARFVPLEIPASLHPRDATAVRALRRALRADLPDVVHAHGLRAGVVAALARPEGCPLVVTWHNRVLATGVRARLLERLEGYLARTADVTLGASSDLVDRVRELGGRDVRLGAVAAPELAAPSRPAAELRHEIGAADGQPVVLSVGRLHPQKGYDLLVAAAARWRGRQPPPLVAIAGSGPMYMRLAAQISAARAPVTLLGHRGDVADLLAVAALAVVSSRWEARQLFAQEALRSGTPLVATTAGGLPDLVGDAAVLIPPGDVDALDGAVQAMLDDPGLRARYAERGLARAATWPTEQDTLAQVCAVYTELGPSAGAARTEERSDKGRRRPEARASEGERQRSGLGAGPVWTDERSEEGRRDLEGPEARASEGERQRYGPEARASEGERQ